jgi:hypothetical protein
MVKTNHTNPHGEPTRCSNQTAGKGKALRQHDQQGHQAARCAMDPYVYLYFCSSSGTAELMNMTNKKMRAQTAVDLLNAGILLIKLEVNRY